jgi:hypothetical protein
MTAVAAAHVALHAGGVLPGYALEKSIDLLDKRFVALKKGCKSKPIVCLSC